MSPPPRSRGEQMHGARSMLRENVAGEHVVGEHVAGEHVAGEHVARACCGSMLREHVAGACCGRACCGRACCGRACCGRACCRRACCGRACCMLRESMLREHIAGENVAGACCGRAWGSAESGDKGRGVGLSESRDARALCGLLHWPGSPKCIEYGPDRLFIRRTGDRQGIDRGSTGDR